MPSVSNLEEREFFLSFIAESEDYRDDGRTDDENIEALENYLVLPPDATGTTFGLSGRATLKDPETHQMVEMWIAKLLLMTLSQHGFVNAMPTGGEDAFKGLVTSKLLERMFRLRSNFRAMYVAFKDAILFGQSVILPSWVYQEGPVQSVKSVVDPFSGQELINRTSNILPVVDDPYLTAIDIDDFFPDPGADTVERMLFAAHRYTIPQYRAVQFGEEGRWDKEQLDLALEGKDSDANATSEDGKEKEQKNWREGLDRSSYFGMASPYKPVVCYEGWGEVPYMPKDGERWRRMTLVNGNLVESRPAPVQMARRMPYCEFVMNPMQGRWRGIAPAVVNRYMQSFSDSLLMCMAEATVRMTTVPLLVGENSGISMSKLDSWKGPIRARDVSDIKELKYDPRVDVSSSLFQMIKMMQRESSGATGGLQGHGLGSKRFTASEAVETFKQAMDRPQLMAQLFENEYLNALGYVGFQLYQQFVETSPDLARRVGATTIMQAGENEGRMPNLNDISGEFDLAFVGSSKMKTNESQLQFLERAFQVFGAVPGAAPLFPWAPALVKWLELAGLRDLEYMVAKPQGVEEFIERSLQMNQSASGGTQPNPGAQAGLPQLDLGGFQNGPAGQGQVANA